MAMTLGARLALNAQGTAPTSDQPEQRVRRNPHLAEWGFVALILALAAAGRLILAARGWPAFESDEAIVGLMTDDIMRHGAHPVFFYGQNYMGALQAYLAVPFFLLRG